jgi:hypothetical protein
VEQSLEIDIKPAVAGPDYRRPLFLAVGRMHGQSSFCSMVTILAWKIVTRKRENVKCAGRETLL